MATRGKIMVPLRASTNRSETRERAFWAPERQSYASNRARSMVRVTNVWVSRTINLP